MKIFLAGATGAIGKSLIPLLVANKHKVIGMTHSPEKSKMLEAMGAEPAIADAFNKYELMAAVQHSKPDVVVHQLTSLSSLGLRGSFDKQFELTNRLRTETTDYLLEAARKAGSRKFIAQSYTGWTNSRKDGLIKTEEDPFDLELPSVMTETFKAIRYVESVVSKTKDIESIALRYGGFYGPGTSLSKGGMHLDLIFKRRFPIIGNGAGIWSFIHIYDAATATLLAIEKGLPGIYNVVDDEPAPVSEWLPYLASAVGAKPPMHIPSWIGRLLAGESMVFLMTQIRGSSNAKAKSKLGWQLRYPSWRQGFLEGLD